MTHHLLSVHSVEGDVRAPMTDEERAQSHKQLGVLEQEMTSAGAWVFSGRLHDPATATVVRIAGGEVVTTDGPFVESKEHLGGFYSIQAEDLDGALGLGVEGHRCHQGADRGPSVRGIRGLRGVGDDDAATRPERAERPTRGLIMGCCRAVRSSASRARWRVAGSGGGEASTRRPAPARPAPTTGWDRWTRA